MARLVAVLAALGCLGCGYQLVRYESGGGLGEVRTVAVATPDNGSFEPGLELVVADALRREFLRRRAVSVVESPEGADLVLSGAVRPLRVQGRSFSTVVLSLEYEITLTLDLTARRADGSDVPIDARALSETEFYLASADAEATRKNREEAVRRLAHLLAGRVADSLSVSLAP